MRESMTSVEATAAGLMAVIGVVAAAAAAGFSSIGVVVGTRGVLRCLFERVAKLPLIPLCSVDLLFCYNMVNNTLRYCQ
jgi:hypothetical protein